MEMVPLGATVRILNIAPKFYQGMALDPGRYHVEVSKPGYKTEKTWVNLKAGENQRVEIKLEQLENPSMNDVLQRDGAYVAYANGIVRDTKTGLEWKVGPDKEHHLGRSSIVGPESQS